MSNVKDLVNRFKGNTATTPLDFEKNKRIAMEKELEAVRLAREKARRYNASLRDKSLAIAREIQAREDSQRNIRDETIKSYALGTKASGVNFEGGPVRNSNLGSTASSSPAGTPESAAEVGNKPPVSSSSSFRLGGSAATVVPAPASSRPTSVTSKRGMGGSGMLTSNTNRGSNLNGDSREMDEEETVRVVNGAEEVFDDGMSSSFSEDGRVRLDIPLPKLPSVNDSFKEIALVVDFEGESKEDQQTSTMNPLFIPPPSMTIGLAPPATTTSSSSSNKRKSSHKSTGSGPLLSPGGGDANNDSSSPPVATTTTTRASMRSEKQRSSLRELVIDEHSAVITNARNNSVILDEGGDRSPRAGLLTAEEIDVAMAEGGDALERASTKGDAGEDEGEEEEEEEGAGRRNIPSGGFSEIHYQVQLNRPSISDLLLKPGLDRMESVASVTSVGSNVTLRAAGEGEPCRLMPGLDIRTVVSTFYQTYAPEKLQDLDLVLEHFRGRSEALLFTLECKYFVSISREGIVTPISAADLPVDPDTVEDERVVARRSTMLSSATDFSELTTDSYKGYAPSNSVDGGLPPTLSQSWAVRPSYAKKGSQGAAGARKQGIVQKRNSEM